MGPPRQPERSDSVSTPLRLRPFQFALRAQLGQSSVRLSSCAQTITITMPRGQNSQGNTYNTPGGTNSSDGSSYHYSNNDGSYYYANDNGSTYYQPPPESSAPPVYTPPPSK